MIFDIHGDIWTDVTIKSLEGERNIIRNHHLDRFRQGGMSGGIFVVWTDPPHQNRPRERLRETLKAMSRELFEARDFLKVMRHSGDYQKAVRENKLAVMLGLEGISAIGDDIDLLYALYQFGFRHIGLTWNEANALATGVDGDPARGLTDLGIQAVHLINELGMILDVSHANDETFHDILAHSTGPVIASHSNARALCDVSRNLSDEQITLIGERNGLVGINAFHEFIDRDPNLRTADRLIDHLEHIVDLIGIGGVALGFDFFEYLSGGTTESFAPSHRATAGLEDVTKTRGFIAALKARGFSEEEIRKICHQNFLDLVDRVIPSGSPG